MARGQTPGRIRLPIDDRQVVRLGQTKHPLATTANSVGHLEANTKFERMLLVLSPSAEQEQELKQLLDEQHKKSSPNYQRWLTAAEFGTRFGVADVDVQKVRGWLESRGFTVGNVAQSKRWIEFSGTSHQVESAFHTEMQYYRITGKTHIANATDVAVPEAMAEVTPGVASLNNFGKRPPRRMAEGVVGRDSQGHKIRLQPNLTAVGATITYYLAPGDLAAIYNTKPLLGAGIDGSGISIAVTAQSDIELTDVQEFRQIFGLKANDPNFIVSGPDPGLANQTDAEEAQLDVEWAGAVAPGATIDLVVAASTATTSGVDLAAAYAIDNEVAPILTYTYGSCEYALGAAGNALYNALWQQAAAEGITVLVAVGDNGAAGCDNANAGIVAGHGLAVNGAASTPYNIAVGGTEFVEGATPSTYWNGTNAADFSSALGYIPEAAWNESCDPGQTASATNCVFGSTNLSLLAGGGGTSTVYAKPIWQTGAGVPADGARDVPDVAIAAASGHDDFVYCTSLGGTPCQLNGQTVTGLTLVGGTSAATPAMAGILALVEQKNGPFQGQANHVLYQLAQMQGNSCDASKQTSPTAQNTCVFYDVTAGSNAVPCARGSAGCSSTVSGTNGFLTGNAAGPGYDLATGLGSVNAANLASAWKNVVLAGSQITLQVSNVNFVHGTPVTLSGAVAATSGTGAPSGAVSIKTDLHGDQPQTLALTNSGTFTGSLSDLPGGQYNLFAHYPGDATFGANNSSVLAMNVAPENSVTTIAVNALQNGTAGYGAALELVVTVAGASGQGRATGTVTIQDGTSVVGIYPLALDGSATIPTGNGNGFAFGVGAHSLTASYAGDNSFNASVSAAVPFTVGKRIPFVVLGVNTATPPSGVVGAHAVVAGKGTISATGTVQFTVDGAAYGTPVMLQTGGFFGNQAQAAILISNLAQGTHVIGASYDGSMDPNYASVASGDPNNELTQTLTVGANAGAKTSATLTAQSPPVNLGDTGIFHVTVSPATTTGTVSLWDTVGPRSGAFPISGGAATIQFPWTEAGSAALYAVYSGDQVNAGSTSAPVAFTVNKGVPQIQLAAPASTTAVQQVSLNASVIGNASNVAIPPPSGIIEIWDSINGGMAQLLATQNLTRGAGNVAVFGTRVKVSPGSHSLHAHYRGDTNWAAGDSATVTLASSSFTLMVSPIPVPVAAGSAGSATVIITPSGGFAGTVALTCSTGGTLPPVGYTCSFAQANVPVSGGTATTQLNLTLSTSAASGAKSAAKVGAGSAAWSMGFAAGILLLGLAGIGANGGKAGRNFLLLGGLVLGIVCVVLGCGGGGSSTGMGQVPTTTTLTSSALKVGFGTPVTFNVLVVPSGSATPTGSVQLFDNGSTYGTPARVNAGVVSFLTTNLPVGVHVITAQYLGDANTLGSSSAPITQVITGNVAMQITGMSNGIVETADFTVAVN